MMVVMAAQSLGQIADARHLAAGGSILELGGKRAELRRSGGVALRLRCLRGGLKVRGDLLRDLLVLGRVLLLQLLERAHQLSKGRKLLAVRWHRKRRNAATAGRAGSRAGRASRTGAAKAIRKERLQVSLGIRKSIYVHTLLIGIFLASAKLLKMRREHLAESAGRRQVSGGVAEAGLAWDTRAPD